MHISIYPSHCRYPSNPQPNNSPNTAPESGGEAQAATARRVGVFAEDQLSTREEQQPRGFLEVGGPLTPLYTYIDIHRIIYI